MWADTLLAAERDFLLRFAIWGGVSLGLGIVVVALARLRRWASPLVTYFSLQTALWGCAALGIAAVWWERLDLRDYESARRLYRLLGALVGLDVALALIGAALALTGWMLGRRLAVAGSGLAMLVQGLGWLVLHLGLASFVRTSL